MTTDHVLLIGLLIAMALVLTGAAAVVLMREVSTSRLDQRIDDLLPDQAAASLPATPMPLGALGRLLRGIGERLSGSKRFYSREDLGALEGAITAAGLNATRALPVILGAKALLTIMIPLAAFGYGVAADLKSSTVLMLVLASVAVGMFGPEWALYFVRRPYIAALRRGLPDALDLLVVCTEAGMGLESALAHVATEIADANPAIAVALSALLDELRVLPDRREAFANFGRRSGVDSIRRLATMLGQTLHYGTPLADALRAVSADLRRERMVAMEEKCTRLPAMLVLPMIAFILPALFIVLAGAPVLRLMDTLHSFSHHH